MYVDTVPSPPDTLSTYPHTKKKKPFLTHEKLTSQLQIYLQNLPKMKKSMLSKTRKTHKKRTHIRKRKQEIFIRTQTPTNSYTPPCLHAQTVVILQDIFDFRIVQFHPVAQTGPIFDMHVTTVVPPSTTLSTPPHTKEKTVLTHGKLTDKMQTPTEN